MTTVTVDVPANLWVTSNSRLHWLGKRCPEPDCPACHTGREKRTWNRWWRRQWKGKEGE